MKAHVIMCNDCPEVVTLKGIDHAKTLLEKYKLGYWENNRRNYKDFDTYAYAVCWHIKVCELEE